MNVLARALAAAPNDPLMLVVAVLALWVPICAAGLAVLWLVAYVQARSGGPPPARPGVVVPPAELRPVLLREVSRVRPVGLRWVTVLRLGIALLVVLGISALIAAANRPALLSVLPG